MVKGYQTEVEIYENGRIYESVVTEVCQGDTVIYSNPVPNLVDGSYNVYVREVEINTETGEVDETDRGYYTTWVG